MADINRFIELISILRNKCPWDKKQTLKTMKNSIIEEAYELVEAVELDETDALKEEVGDILFVGFFFARLLEDEKGVSLEELLTATIKKYKEKHPHVFKNQKLEDSKAVLQFWHKSKKDIFSGVVKSLPALLAAKLIQERVSKIGFDWDSYKGALEKVYEEIKEVEESIGKKETFEELGDLLFACVNLARHLSVDPEDALKHANKKFIERFRLVEKELENQGKTITDVNLEEMDEIWNDLKKKSET